MLCRHTMCFTLRIHTYTHTHTWIQTHWVRHTHNLSFSLSHSDVVCMLCRHTMCFTLRIHTYTHTHTWIQTHWVRHTHTLSLFLSRTAMWCVCSCSVDTQYVCMWEYVRCARERKRERERERERESLTRCVCMFLFYRHTICLTPRIPTYTHTHKWSETHWVKHTHSLSFSLSHSNMVRMLWGGCGQ